MTAIVLSNGVRLTEVGEMIYGHDMLKRDTVKEIFLGRVMPSVDTLCSARIPDCDSPGHYKVSYYSDLICIGCVDFFEGDIAKVKEWLNNENEASATQPGQSAEREHHSESPAQSGDQGNDQQRDGATDAPENLATEPAEIKRTTETSGD